MERHRPPPFIYTPDFPRLTRQQRDLLVKLVNLTLDEGEYIGEFWWRADPDEPSIVTQIKPRTVDGDFDPDNPAFQGKKWQWVADQAQMLTLDRLGYVVISEIREYGKSKELWRHFAVTQQGFDFYRHLRRPLIVRFFVNAWEMSENHLLAFLFGILGAVSIEVVRRVASVLSSSGSP